MRFYPTFMRLFLALCLFSAPAHSGSVFDPPGSNEWELLLKNQNIQIEDVEKKLRDPLFVYKPNFYSSASFYFTPSGEKEFQKTISSLLAIQSSTEEFVFIGRSPIAMHTYLEGMNMQLESKLKLKSLPFSYGYKESPTPQLRAALRKYMEEKGLDPLTILTKKNKTVFVDFVYSGTGAQRLLDELTLWARELNVADALKAKLEFFGLFPANMISEIHYRGLAHSMNSDFGKTSEIPREWIEKYANELELPGKSGFLNTVSKVHELKISTSFYTYAGTHGPHLQQSFTRESWMLTHPNSLPLELRLNEPAVQEMLALYRKGTRHTLCPVISEAIKNILY